MRRRRGSRSEVRAFWCCVGLLSFSFHSDRDRGVEAILSLTLTLTLVSCLALERRDAQETSDLRSARVLPAPPKKS